MKTNTAKQTLLQGRPAFGYAAKLGSPVAAELLGLSGVDFVTIDTQHGSWGIEAAIAALPAICATPATPIARVLNNQYHLMAQLLDAGVMGLIVPLVNSVEDACAVAAACYYPPLGERSYGWARAAAYGNDYPEWIAEQLLVTVQIETPTAVANAEAILSVPGIHGCVIGPMDLGVTMGLHPRDIPKSDEHRRALERVVQACHNTGKIPGIDTGSPESVALRLEQGFRLISMGNDVRFMQGGADAGLRLVRQHAGA